ncbi:hypothetical protein BJ508DRAFT_50373 [Ascobolus immersus RN42]|uniref:Uncharacterized protein n=1 Tax=Ascobolus immersus RN42 TaxID=1160509 RepID=A0A3N4IQ54_ASCIM|nr:hypothetical protein BJ508DRAFT_50373 [Ascobolus immersus RN42]
MCLARTYPVGAPNSNLKAPNPSISIPASVANTYNVASSIARPTLSGFYPTEDQDEDKEDEEDDEETHRQADEKMRFSSRAPNKPGYVVVGAAYFLPSVGWDLSESGERVFPTERVAQVEDVLVSFSKDIGIKVNEDFGQGEQAIVEEKDDKDEGPDVVRDHNGGPLDDRGPSLGCGWGGGFVDPDEQ